MLSTLTLWLFLQATATVSWLPNPISENVLKYTVYEVTTVNVKLADVTAGTSYQITNLTPGQHCYVVTATNSVGEGPASAPPACTGVAAKLPSQVSGVTVTVKTGGGVPVPKD